MNIQGLYSKIAERLGAERSIIMIQPYTGQYINPRAEVFYPFVFVEFSSIAWAQMQGGRKQGEVSLTLHIGHQITDNAEAFSEVQQKVVRLLEGYFPSDTESTAMRHTSDMQDTYAEQGLYVWKSTFEVVIEENTRSWQEVPVQIEADVKVKKKRA